MTKFNELYKLIMEEFSFDKTRNDKYRELLDQIRNAPLKTFEVSVLPVFRQIREELTEWINDKIRYLNKDEFESMVEHGNPEACQIDAISQFLEETAKENFNERQIAICMQCIVDAYDEERNNPDNKPSIFDKDIIRKGIEKFLEEEWDIESD